MRQNFKTESNPVKNRSSNQVRNSESNQLRNSKSSPVVTGGQRGTTDADNSASVGYLIALDTAVECSRQS